MTVKDEEDEISLDKKRFLHDKTMFKRTSRLRSIRQELYRTKQDFKYKSRLILGKLA